jgi:hypothetical protein
MDHNGEHHVARIDDTVTPASLHERAEAVAVPDFDYLGQTVGAIAVGLTRRHESGRYESGRYESGRYESGRYESGRYESGRYETGRHETGRHETGWKTHEQA